jgi:hypothetical protein
VAKGPTERMVLQKLWCRDNVVPEDMQLWPAIRCLGCAGINVSSPEKLKKIDAKLKKYRPGNSKKILSDALFGI